MLEQYFIELDDKPTWDTIVNSYPHSFFHTHACCQQMALAHQQTVKLYVAQQGDKRIACPLVIRSFQNSQDVCTPYGYNGFIGDLDFNAIASYFTAWMAQQHIICGYILSHPLSYCPSKLLMNPAYIINLQAELPEIFNKFSNHHKRHIKKSAKSNSSITVDKSVLIPAFLDLYYNFALEKQLSATYLFTKDALQEICKHKQCYMLGVKNESKITAISIFLHTPYCAEFFLNAAQPDARHTSKMLIWQAIQYYHHLGIADLNLGGGIQLNDSLALFKKQFGAKAVQPDIKKIIFSEQSFNALCDSTLLDADNHYFPPYYISL